jgi:Sec-independent protein translocase protein TatA
VGFGTEIVFVLMLGLVVLGPKRLHTMLGQVVRAKAKFEAASRDFKTQLATELNPAPQDGTTDSMPETLVEPRIIPGRGIDS